MKSWFRISGCIFLAFLFSGGLTGCGTTPSTKLSDTRPTSVKKKPGNIPKTPDHSPRGQWVLASRNPPVFHPKELENPDYRDGRWIATFGPGARWFIPKGGVEGRSEKQLEEEALVLRTNFQKGRGALQNGGTIAARRGAGAAKFGMMGILEIVSGLY